MNAVVLMRILRETIFIAYATWHKINNNCFFANNYIIGLSWFRRRLVSLCLQQIFRGQKRKLESGPMPNVMAAQPNVRGVLCWILLIKSWKITKPRHETRWNICWGAPKLVNRSQPLVGQSSPYYEDNGRRYCCLTFFQIVDTCLNCEDIARNVVRWCADGELFYFWRFLRRVFSASRVQHISDLHSKFALRPHHLWKYGRHPIFDRWE